MYYYVMFEQSLWRAHVYASPPDCRCGFTVWQHRGWSWVWRPLAWLSHRRKESFYLWPKRPAWIRGWSAFFILEGVWDALQFQIIVFFFFFLMSTGYPHPEHPFWSASGDSGVCRWWSCPHGLLCGDRLWGQAAHWNCFS